MKVRGMMSPKPADLLRLNSPVFFFVQTSFFSFHLTGLGVFYNHHRVPAA